MGGLSQSSVESRLCDWRARLVVLAVLALPACALDQRELSQEGDGGGRGGSAPSTGGTGAGGNAPPGWNAPPPPACVYHGEEVEPGCETLVENPGFDTTAEGWPGQIPSVVVGWNDLDAAGGAESGSIKVDSTLFSEDAEGVVILGAVQCVPAEGGGVYDVRADAFIPKQDAEGAAGLTMLFYKNTTCDAGVAGTDLSFTTPLVTDVDKWVEVSGRFIAPSGVGSMQVELVVGKHFAPRSFKALFDNVLVQAK
jgi:hypothetical protein